MSIRPRQVAEEATRFSLRTVFGSLDQQLNEDEEVPSSHAVAAAPPTAAAQTSPTSPTTPTALPTALPTAGAAGGLHFDLGLPSKATTPLLALPTTTTTTTTSSQGLKFTLPAMRVPDSEHGSVPVKSTTAEAGNKMLRAGYIVGGSQGSQTEVLRLNGVIDDLQHKLKKCSDRLATTEQSVARGNAALQSERATSHARMVALAGQVREAQTREAAVRAEMEAMPKVSDYDQQRFEMQAQGALQLEQRYEEEVGRVAALEEVLATLKLEQETAAAEHAALQAELETTKAELETTKVAMELAETTNASVKREALEMIAEAEAKTDALLAEKAQAAGEVATAAAANAEDMEAMKTALEEATAALQRSEAAVEAEVAKGAEADVIIKGLDLKIHDLRNDLCKKEEETLKLAETAAATANRAGEALFEAQQAKEALSTLQKKMRETPTSDTLNAANDAAIVQAFEHYYALKKVAEQTAGTADAAHHRARALQAYETLANGPSESPLVYSCCLESSGHSPEDEADIHAVSAAARMALATSVCTAGRLCGTHRDADCEIDLCSTTTTTTTSATSATPTDTAPLALKMRTEDYVKAVSMDLKRGITHASRRWISAAGGELPPLPAECDLSEKKIEPAPVAA